MSQNRSPNQGAEQGKFKSFFKTYMVGFMGSNAALFVGHPAERLKVAAQINLGVPAYQVVKPILSSFSALYTGFVSCVYRQNVKLVYRSMIMSEMPHRVDDLGLNFFFGTALKALFASSIDTAFTTPPENIKTWQMKMPQQTSIRTAVSQIYQARGLRGFFFGIEPTIFKSYPTWFYLFLGYHATKDKRQKQGFLSTILWATCASIPITAMTNPLDVIKTQMQASAHKKSDSILSVGKELVQKHGLFSLARGFPFRLVHKSLATATAYAVLDMSSKLRS
jgi:solute carrier family 25 carnitine/acylcarnitine transporter 20/29